MTSDKLHEIVEANMLAEAVPAGLVDVNSGEGYVSVRNRGCFILETVLVDPSTGEGRPVMFSEENQLKPKLSASHPMSPVGPSEGVGGQHGYPRWVDYIAEVDEDVAAITMFAEVNPDGLEIEKYFSLSTTGSKLTTETTIGNSNEEAYNTSMGAHDYFVLKDEKIDGLLIDGKPLDEVFGEGAEASIMSGGTEIIDDFSGQADVYFPEGYTLRISANGVINGEQASKHLVKLMVWHRPGTESICLEPTFGYLGDGQEMQLNIEPGNEANLLTSVELI